MKNVSVLVGGCMVSIRAVLVAVAWVGLSAFGEESELQETSASLPSFDAATVTGEELVRMFAGTKLDVGQQRELQRRLQGRRLSFGEVSLHGYGGWNGDMTYNVVPIASCESDPFELELALRDVREKEKLDLVHWKSSQYLVVGLTGAVANPDSRHWLGFSTLKLEDVTLTLDREPIELLPTFDPAKVTGDELASFASGGDVLNERLDRLSQELEGRRLEFTCLYVRDEPYFYDTGKVQIRCGTAPERDKGFPVLVEMERSVVDAWSRDPVPADLLTAVSGVVVKGRGVLLKDVTCTLSKSEKSDSVHYVVLPWGELTKGITGSAKDLGEMDFRSFWRRNVGRKFTFATCTLGYVDSGNDDGTIDVRLHVPGNTYRSFDVTVRAGAQAQQIREIGDDGILKGVAGVVQMLPHRGRTDGTLEPKLVDFSFDSAEAKPQTKLLELTDPEPVSPEVFECIQRLVPLHAVEKFDPNTVTGKDLLSQHFDSSVLQKQLEGKRFSFDNVRVSHVRIDEDRQANEDSVASDDSQAHGNPKPAFVVLTPEGETKLRLGFVVTNRWDIERLELSKWMKVVVSLSGTVGMVDQELEDFTDLQFTDMKIRFMNEPLVLPDLDDAAVVTGDALAKRCAHFVFEKKRAEKIAQELDKRELAFSRLKIDRVFVDKDFTICCRTESELKDGGLPLAFTVRESVVDTWAHDPTPGDVLLNVSGIVSGFSRGKGVSLEVKSCGIEGPGINPTDDIKASKDLVSCLSRIPEDLRVAAFARICRRLRGRRIDFRNCFCITSLKRHTYRTDLAAERLGVWTCSCVRNILGADPQWDITLSLEMDRRCKVTVQRVGRLKKLAAYDVLSGFGVKSVSGIVRIESEGLVLTKERFSEEDVAAIWGKAGPDGR